MKKYALPVIALSTSVLAIMGTHSPNLSNQLSGAMFLPASASSAKNLMASAKTGTSENLTPEQLDTLLEELSEQGFDQNSYGLYLIHSAKNNNLAHVRIMLSLNADVNTTDAHGDNALIWAAHNGHTDIVRFLVTVENINLDYVDNDGCSALRWAEQRGHTECAEILRRAGAHSIQRTSEAAAALSQEEAATRLQLLGISPNAYNAAICSATDESNNNLLRYLIIAGADVNSVADDGFTPITNVCLYGNTDGLRLLLAAPGIDINRPNGNGDTAVIWAAVKGNTDCLRLLLNTPGIDINHIDNDGKTAYLWAIENGHEACAELLRAAGGFTSDNRNTARPDAADSNTPQERLLAMGITPNRYNQAICIATDNKNNGLLSLLIAAGADVNTDTYDGWTPLTNCCMYENVEGVRILLAAPGIDVNKPNRIGDTAIIWAAVRGNATCLRMLMDMPGIDINFIDSDGRTALDWAQQKGHNTCARMLRQAGAKTAAQLRRH